MKPEHKKDLSTLMREMGSTDGRWSPEANDWWLYDLRHARCADTRLFALLKSCTVARRNPKPWATDDNGKPIDYSYIAQRLDWKERTARNEMALLVNQGRVKIDEEGRFCPSADVPLAHLPSDPDAAGDSDSPDTWDDFVQSHFSGYLADSVRSLPKTKRESFVSKYSAFAKYRPDVAAEAMAAARLITERYEDNILREFGIPKNRLTKRRDLELKWLKVEEKSTPDFVQSQEPVCTNPETSSYKPESENVQTDASLLCLQNQNQKASSSVESSQVVAVVGRGNRAETDSTDRLAPILCAFDQIGHPADDQAVDRLLTACVQVDPTITPEEISTAVQIRGRKISRGVRNPVAFLLSDVPAYIDSKAGRMWLQRERKATDPASPDPANELEPLPPERTVISTSHCRKCGGLRETFDDGFTSSCACVGRRAVSRA
jgi:hypothetical protein